ncbi:MAG: NAD(P)/FAD-dependent oxidoreductase [Pleurocapsa minor GSE-CHR-MK-17-07R]|jgi:predicted Rossmann fold flavoprotein|nr:NAD(P)/FAD-dependent oxidoreductase [Pleurocapsa minor GSE-CHR-MK 17-07R]
MARREKVDIAIIGAGAAGMFAGIWAGVTNRYRRIVLLDGAKTLGAKILVAGGGRCNVTHDVITGDEYSGSSRNAIRKVLRRFDVAQTTEFFADLGVELKREETGKLFPTTDKAKTVLNALVKEVKRVGVDVRYPIRVDNVKWLEGEEYFRVYGEWGELFARKVVLATGGKSLPKSGSDGGGYVIARHLGHTITDRVMPALVPLTLPAGHWVTTLSGISTPATLSVHAGTGKRLISFTDDMLCTHFGLSGPAVLDISRHLQDAQMDDAQAKLVINWLPSFTAESFEAHLLNTRRVSSARLLMDLGLPERLARALCEQAGADGSAPADQLTRAQRRQMVAVATACDLPVTGTRGYTYAEVTAGGVPLSEIKLETMESVVRPNLYLCGEICDVDGRIGGYNFQWAWSSGYLAGVSV